MRCCDSQSRGPSLDCVGRRFGRGSPRGQACGHSHQPFFVREGTKNCEQHGHDVSVLEPVDVDECGKAVSGAEKELRSMFADAEWFQAGATRSACDRPQFRCGHPCWRRRCELWSYRFRKGGESLLAVKAGRGGKSEHHRARCRVTCGPTQEGAAGYTRRTTPRGVSMESATENKPPAGISKFEISDG